ncbi:MAG: ribosome-binding factor A [Opitutia bacterium]|nr:MAG: ribosome-binding factor A [Opitutae bacterium]
MRHQARRLRRVPARRHHRSHRDAADASVALSFMSQRQLRVAELVQREVSTALRQSWPTEAALITITVASVSPDLRQCRVGYAVSGDDAVRKKARAFLKRVRTELRSTVGGILQMKHAPDILFTEDDITGGVARVQALLDEMTRKDRTTNPPKAD